MRTSTEEFERIYRREPDPWGYETSAYEQAKYARTLAALGDRRYRNALELGSSIGVFTAALALRCDAVVALEPSTTALARARIRLADAPNVRFLQGAIPEDIPDGSFDLIVCSEVLFYLSEPLLRQSIRELEQRLARGGTLIAVHYTTPGVLPRLLRRLQQSRPLPRPPAPLSGARVHELLRDSTRLQVAHHERHRTYVLDRFDAAD